MFRQRLEERFKKYGLELAEEKTKILEFGRFARQIIVEWTERSNFSVVG